MFTTNAELESTPWFATGCNHAYKVVPLGGGIPFDLLVRCNVMLIARQAGIGSSVVENSFKGLSQIQKWCVVYE